MLRKISVMVCGLTALIMLAACSGVESKENTGAAGVSTENTEESQTSALTETPVATPTETSTETPAPAPHDHSYTSAVTKEATCEADGQGEITYTCSICGDTYTEETDRIDHCTDDVKVIQEATCSQVGIKTYSCIFCGREFEREELPKLAHTESDWIVVQEVVGDKNGLQHKVCTICGEELATEEIYPEIVASGVLAEGKIEWKIIGTTLYVSGDGEIPGFSDREEQFRDWQLYKDIVEKIIIEDGITKIGKKNFVGFVKTKEVIFSDSVTELGEMAFYYSGLENIDFNNINKLGKLAFSNSHNLKSVVIPGTIKNIPVSCFYYCNNLTEIYIDEGVETISQGALDVSNGQNITIHLPSSISNIHGEAWGIGLTVYVKSGSYAETFVQEAAQRENLTVIVE